MEKRSFCGDAVSVCPRVAVAFPLLPIVWRPASCEAALNPPSGALAVKSNFAAGAGVVDGAEETGKLKGDLLSAVASAAFAPDPKKLKPDAPAGAFSAGLGAAPRKLKLGLLFVPFASLFAPPLKKSNAGLLAPSEDCALGAALLKGDAPPEGFPHENGDGFVSELSPFVKAGVLSGWVAFGLLSSGMNSESSSFSVG